MTGLKLADGAELKLITTLGTDHTISGITKDGVAGENLVFGDLVYFKSDSKWWKAKSDTAATCTGELAIAIATISANATGEILIYGRVRDDSWNWGTVGGNLFVDMTTAGTMSQTAPTGTGKQVRIVGIAKDANNIFFNPDSTVLELA